MLGCDIEPATSTLRPKYACGRIGGKREREEKKRDAKRAKTSGIDAKRARAKRTGSTRAPT
jgi:hypothetical protein